MHTKPELHNPPIFSRQKQEASEQKSTFEERFASEHILSSREWFTLLLEFPTDIEYVDTNGDGRIDANDHTLTSTGHRELMIRIGSFQTVPESTFRSIVTAFLTHHSAPIDVVDQTTHSLKPGVIAKHITQLKAYCLQQALKGDDKYRTLKLEDRRWTTIAGNIITTYPEKKAILEKEMFIHSKQHRFTNINATALAMITATLAEMRGGSDSMYAAMTFITVLELVFITLRKNLRNTNKRIKQLQQNYILAASYIVLQQDPTVVAQLSTNAHYLNHERQIPITANDLHLQTLQQIAHSMQHIGQPEQSHPLQKSTNLQSIFTLSGEASGSITQNINGLDKKRTFQFINPNNQVINLSAREIINSAQSAQIIKNLKSVIIILSHNSKERIHNIYLTYQDYEALITAAFLETNPDLYQLFAEEQTHTAPTDFEYLQQLLDSTDKAKSKLVLMAVITEVLTIVLTPISLRWLLLQDLAAGEFIFYITLFVALFSISTSLSLFDEKIADSPIPQAIANELHAIITTNKASAERKKRLLHSK